MRRKRQAQRVQQGSLGEFQQRATNAYVQRVLLLPVSSPTKTLVRQAFIDGMRAMVFHLIELDELEIHERGA